MPVYHMILSQEATQYQDQVYKKLFPIQNISRYEKVEERILDIKYHIDVELELTNGIKLLGQEKALRPKFAKFNTFTIEFYQNRFTKEPGEFFNIGAQFYLHGYWNDDFSGLQKWYMVKLFDFLAYLKQFPVKSLEKRTRPSTSNASFFYVEYPKIPNEFLYAKHS